MKEVARVVQGWLGVGKSAGELSAFETELMRAWAEE